MSPAFDINPTPEQKLRQTSIAGADHLEAAADGLRELAKTCRLSPDGAGRELLRVAEALRSWRDTAMRHGVAEAQLSRFERAFRDGDTCLRSAARTARS